MTEDLLPAVEYRPLSRDSLLHCQLASFRTNFTQTLEKVKGKDFGFVHYGTDIRPAHEVQVSGVARRGLPLRGAQRGARESGKIGATLQLVQCGPAVSQAAVAFAADGLAGPAAGHANQRLPT